MLILTIAAPCPLWFGTALRAKSTVLPPPRTWPKFCSETVAKSKSQMLSTTTRRQKSGRVRKARKLAKTKSSRSTPFDDAEACDSSFFTVPYEKEVRIGPKITMRLTDQGHILGSSAATMTIERPDGSEFKIVFSGDLGRPDMPILRDPSPLSRR